MIPLNAIALALMPLGVTVVEPPAVVDGPMFMAQRLLTSISRDTLRQINQRSGGMDEHGYLTQPILITDIYPNFTLGNGVYEQPMAWHPDHSILFEVRDGYMVRLNFRFDSFNRR